MVKNFDEKIAYPNIAQNVNIPGSYNVQKWLQAVKEVYYGEKSGFDRKAAIRKATSGWNVIEVYDFINWLRFYEEGTHLKYKTAQYWYGDADRGYLLPIKPDSAKPVEESVSGRDVDFARDNIADELSITEKKRIIEKQRQKIIGRLDSAEKLLRSPEGQIFSDKEFESLLESIYDLKKKIQIVNKKSTSVKLYNDLIIRQANVLTHRGFVKAANLLHSLAQDKIPTPETPAPPMEGSGAAGGLPSAGPGAPEVSPPNNTPNPQNMTGEQEVPKGIADFLQGLETGKKTMFEDLDQNDLDQNDVLEVIDTDDNLLVEAQVAPPPSPASSATSKVSPPVSVEKVPEVKTNIPASPEAKDVDGMINSVFSNLTIADVVAKFEDIAKFYKTRELPRQLALADMMLDSIGLAPFFPTLSEATNKALEANNYISSRIEDILSKLRGTMKTREIDVIDDEEKKISPEIEQAKQTLKEQTDKELAKKQMRKDLEEKALKDQVKETPEIEVEEDLEDETPAPPAPTVPTVPPTPARPTV